MNTISYNNEWKILNLGNQKSRVVRASLGNRLPNTQPKGVRDVFNVFHAKLQSQMRDVRSRKNNDGHDHGGCPCRRWLSAHAVRGNSFGRRIKPPQLSKHERVTEFTKNELRPTDNRQSITMINPQHRKEELHDVIG